MRYYINAYDKEDNDDWKQHIVFESDKRFKDEYMVCDKLISYVVFGEDELLIPEGVTTLCKNFYIDDEEDIMDPDCTKLVLPASLTEIEPDTFQYMSFESITVDPNNKAFIIKNDGLFTADGKRLICIISQDDYYGGVYKVPEGTESIDGFFLDGVSLRIPKSVTQISTENYWDELLRSIIAPKDSYAIEFAKKYKFDYEIEDANQ